MKLPLVVALASVFFVGSASASDYIGLSTFGIDTDDVRAAEDGLGFRLNYGWGDYDHLQWELQFGQASLETGAAAGTDFYQTILGFDAAWRFRDPSIWQPYVLLGLGAVYDDVTPDTADDTNAFVNAGLGLLTPPLSQYNLRLRFDARYVHSEFAERVQDIHYGLGFEIPLGQEKLVEQVVEKIVYRDVLAVLPALIDSDFDSVGDDLDRCPATLRGARVDAVGCVIEQQVIVLYGLQFESESEQFVDSSSPQLEAISQAMLAQPGLRVELSGHTDATGSVAHNLLLSQRRANAVRNYLINIGIAEDRLIARGYGESLPITENRTAEGRAQNRRVEFRVLGN